jgi:acyl carrier protein
MQLKREIKNYIIESFLYGQDDNTLDDDVSFLETGIIDSTGVLELVSFVQETYGITVTDDELVPDNFDSLNKLEQFITRKMTAGKLERRDAPEQAVQLN